MITIGILLILLFSVGTLALVYTRDQQRILAGVNIAGIAVGNLSQDEAKKLIDQRVSSMLSQTLRYCRHPDITIHLEVLACEHAATTGTQTYC